MKVSPQEKQKALDDLRELLKPGDRIYTVLRHRSRSGMQRVIDLHVIRDGKLEWLAWRASRALGWPMHPDHQGIKVNGCGMDMGFHLVYSLSYALWPEGFGCVGECCHSNDHSNGDRDYVPHGIISGTAMVGLDDLTETEHVHWHRDGGYALKQEWL